MNQIVLDIVDYFIISGTYCMLLIYLYLFITNFTSHFKCNYKCPWLLRDEEVSGIYPTLLSIHILISFMVSLFIVCNTWNDEYYMAHSTFTFTSCYMQFKIFSTDVLQPNFMHNPYYLIVLWAMCILFLLETYFSYSRYYGCIMVVAEFRSPSKWRVFLPYTVYIAILFILTWCTVSMIPIIMLFLCIFHFIVNTYFSYCFYISVKMSYSQVFKQHNNMRFIGDAFDQMQHQIKQIRFVFQLAMLSAFVTAFINVSFTLCSTFRMVPFGICCNTFCLYLMFTKNRVLLKSTIRCQCTTVHELMCIIPCIIIQKRRESAFPKPTTLMKIKTVSQNSLKRLRQLPKQMTPVLERIRTSSKFAPPPNTPRMRGTPSDANLDIIDEDNPNKFPLDAPNTSHSISTQKRNSTTRSDDHDEEITTNSAKVSSRSRHLKPYSLTTSSFASSPVMTARVSMDSINHFNHLDTIPAEDEIITFAPTTSNSAKPYKLRSHDINASNVSVPSMENFEVLTTYNVDEEDALEHGLVFGRMKNIRATMRQDHIDEIKLELASFNDDEEEDIEIEIQDKENEDDQRSSLKKKVQQIEFTKEELEREKKVLELKKKTNKRIGFGADMALEIVQQSIAQQEEKRKAAQHEFYVTAITNARASTARQLTPTKTNDNIDFKVLAPKATPIPTPERKRTLIDNANVIQMLGIKQQNSANTNASDDTNEVILTDDDLDERMPSQTPVNNSHVRSRSDNQMIVDIANQMALHAKQIKKTGSERSRKLNTSKLKDRNKKKKVHPKPKLNLKSVSEDVDKRKRSDDMERHGHYLSPDDANITRKYDDGEEERSPSPPPEAYLDVMNPFRNTGHESSTHSILQTVRSWMMPSFHRQMSSTNQSESDRANNMNMYLKKQGLTIHSTKDRIVDVIPPIPENKRMVDMNGESAHPDRIEEEEHEYTYDDEEEEDENCNVATGHSVFNININDVNFQYVDEYKDQNIIGHSIMNLDVIDTDLGRYSSSECGGHIRAESTAL